MESTTTTTFIATNVIFDQNNKENIPPLFSLCNTTMAKCNNKKKKNTIQTKVPSFKCIGSGNKRKPKRIPFSDITNLFNNSSSTFTLSHRRHHHHRQLGNSVSAISSPISISRCRVQVVSPSKTLRIGFR
ncbi:hypothetical protein Lal_00029348 [Lupinus albus]|uniref:Uncharacterized protein n=1 Tax=Lupinus albus TaxID=3870 RepID=A0A6A5NK50_LUPAL|nr:hypothetical protein Lalb_Chr19g0134971 [Lupinus albus]KAF1885459.1 hypothetical protein Lal_00029348 [Lupinus albus]